MSKPPYAPLVRLLALAWLAAAAFASDIERLAALHGAPGAEGAVAAYVNDRLGGGAEIDNTGSLTITFGSGAPHTLLIAGLDEPGYVVSEITAAGYLRLQRLADPLPNYQFDTFFAGQPVRVTLAGGKYLPAVVAAPSVHFAEGRSAPSIGRLEALYVDLGAASEEEVLAAGVSILDTVTLERTPFRLGPTQRVTAPWISSRSGAAVLLALADRLAQSPPSETITLAFVAQQHYHNRGMVRVLERIGSDRIVVIRPGGEAKLAIGAASGFASELQQTLVGLAEKLGIDAERTGSLRLSYGPFGSTDVFRDAKQAALLTVGVEHEGTPVETVSAGQLAAATRLLGALCGLEPRPQEELEKLLLAETEPPSKEAPQIESSHRELAQRIGELVELPGVSETEGPVRDWIRNHLPAWARERHSIDEEGNLIVKLGAAGPPRVVVIAHMDEIGFQVTSTPESGPIRAKVLGGGASELFAWHPVMAHGDGGKLIRGIMMAEGSIDIGASGGAQAREWGVKEGAGAAVPRKLRRLLGNRVTARALDDRAGCAVLLSALHQTKPRNSGPALWIVLSVREEVGLLGAEHVASQGSVRRVYPVDSFVTSDSPLETTRLANARLGQGAVVRAIDSSGITPREEVERVRELARSRSIPLQVGVTAGGNDGSKFVPKGAVNIPLSFALRYSHSPAEVADLGDIEALVRLITAVIDEELGSER